MGVQHLGLLVSFLDVSKLPILCAQGARIELGADSHPRPAGFECPSEVMRASEGLQGLRPAPSLPALRSGRRLRHAGDAPRPWAVAHATARNSHHLAKEQDDEEGAAAVRARHRRRA